MAEQNLRFRLLSFLLLFLFGGAIVGETVSLSMAVTVAGAAVLGKLFFINGMLLFFLPALFFSNIDRVNRGKLLSAQLLAVAGILFCYCVLFIVVGKENLEAVSFWILLIYPVSYLSKTTLFLTFWTMANDIYTTDEAKRGFPKIAAWGFVGGLCGACGARLLLVAVDAEMIIGLWAAAYCVAFVLSRKITARYWIKFIKKEVPMREQAEGKGIFAGILGVLSNRLIRLIAILYFLVFIAIFFQDYLFWKKSALWFTTSNSLASFQFTFYLVYSVVIIGGLQFAMPGVIAKWGFTRIFYLLPVTLLLGSLVMLALSVLGGSRMALFSGFIIFQFLRYVVFENAFSPVYQMFFAVIPKEKRGRAKTFLDGMVKPSAIMLTGLLLMAAEPNVSVILLMISLASCAMVFAVAMIRKTYTEALIPQPSARHIPDEIIAEIGSRHDQKILSLIKEYSSSNDGDVRSLAVKILSREGSKQAFKILCSIYDNEPGRTVREMIARSLASFSGSGDVQPMIEKMLRDENPRVRANALFSLNAVDADWKGRLYSTVKSMFFESNPRVQIEAAVYLWQTGDDPERENVLAYLGYLLSVKNANRRSAGLYLVAALKPEGWEETLLANLQSSSLQVFIKSVEIIFSSASKKTQCATLRVVEGLSRRHIAAAGRVLQQQGAAAITAITEYLRGADTKRMIVECIHALRVVIESSAEGLKGYPLSPETTSVLSSWVLRELEQVYRDCVAWSLLQKKDREAPGNDGMIFLEDALREHLSRVCEWALDVATLLDPKGVMVAGRRDLDVSESTQRFNLIELLDNFGPHHITMLITPILRRDPWEKLAKTGKGFFTIEEGGEPDIGYFVRSSNRLISMCALNVLRNMADRERLITKEKETLEKIRKDHHSYAAKAAAQLLSPEAMSNTMTIDAFELLERVMSLKKTPLFGNVPAEKLMELAEITQRLSYQKGTLISREGELSDHLYIVAKGSLKIVKVKNNVKSILSIVRRGETYGEIGLFNQAPRSASALANEDCELWVIQRSALKRILLDMPEIAYNLLEVFSEKLRKSGDEVALLHTTLSNSIKE
ncbi:MAG TPA: cyclic nucleotide-binding domain-containing protein [Chitinivibrionales bacterium]|nr:cyclic nucleotide-binding domain-containing protein [Chitinivibrionales bacterium]